MKVLSDQDRKSYDFTCAKLQSYPHVLTRYYNYLISQGKSFGTAQKYVKNVTRFLDQRFEVNIPDNFYSFITPNDIEIDISSISSDASKALRWSALNSLFQFLVPDYVNKNPVSAIPRPSVDRQEEMVFLTLEETAKVFLNVKELSSPEFLNRDLSILMLGFYCGLKMSSLVQLNVADIDFVRRVITVQGKSESTILVPFGHKVGYQLELWLKDREENYASITTNALFLSKWGKRISDDIVQVMLAKYSDGIGKKVTAQVMRNTCLLNLYHSTGDMQLCAEFLNHTNIASTQRYIAQLTSGKTKREAARVLEELYESVDEASVSELFEARKHINTEFLDVLDLHGVDIETIKPMLRCVADLLVLKAEKHFETEAEPMQPYLAARKAAREVRQLTQFVDRMMNS